MSTSPSLSTITLPTMPNQRIEIVHYSRVLQPDGSGFRMHSLKYTFSHDVLKRVSARYTSDQNLYLSLDNEPQPTLNFTIS